MNLLSTSLHEWSNKKSWLFLWFCIASITLFVLAQYLLVSDDLYYELLGEQLTFEKINEIININKKWSWIAYPLMPVYYLAKFLAITLVVYMGILLANYSITLGRVFAIVIISEFVFLIPTFVKIIWFQFVQIDYSLTELQGFYPLSLYGLLNEDGIEAWLVYPLQVINVFELLYCICLAYGLAIFSKESPTKMLVLVFCTYGAALVVWIIFMLFLNVSFTA